MKDEKMENEQPKEPSLEERVAQCEEMIGRLVEALKLTNAALMKQARDDQGSSIIGLNGRGMRRQ